MNFPGEIYILNLEWGDRIDALSITKKSFWTWSASLRRNVIENSKLDCSSLDLFGTLLATASIKARAKYACISAVLYGAHRSPFEIVGPTICINIFLEKDNHENHISNSPNSTCNYYPVPCGHVSRQREGAFSGPRIYLL
jgi:hypothetical protein